MDPFYNYIRGQIPVSYMENWTVDIDVSHSCFRFEHVNIFSCSFTGKGSSDPNEMMIDIIVRLAVNHSSRIQIIYKKEKGLENAIRTLFALPDTCFVCLECATIYASKKEECLSCLFFKAYTEYKNISETCSICLSNAYRTQLECGHFFHKTCLLSLDLCHATCPNCRHPITKTFLMDLLEEEIEDESSETDSVSEEESVAEET